MKMWRKYELIIDVWDPKASRHIKTSVTFKTTFFCDNGKLINATMRCNGSPDCKDKSDEESCSSPNTSRKYPKLIFVYMVFVIIIYFIISKLSSDEPEPPKRVIIDRRECTIKYKDVHSSLERTGSVDTMQNMILEEMNATTTYEERVELFKRVRNAEGLLHKNDPEKFYKCTLQVYGGDSRAAKHIGDPQGYLIDRLNECFGNNVNFYFLNIFCIFLGLCSHIFDYVKDIDLSASLYYFDHDVIQQQYFEYDDFNFTYLTYISVFLLIVTQVLVPRYWFLLDDKMKPLITLTRENDSDCTKLLKRLLPYIPTNLPILLFCRRAHLNRQIQIYKFKDEFRAESLNKEANQIEIMANDIKILGK